MSILFHNEWRNAEGKLRAIPHVSTKNESFLRTSALLKRMGVKNYAFMLALYDPDLANVDVHDLEENTAANEVLRTKVQIEARRNVWYFIRECVRIYSQGGSPVQFGLNRASCAMIWCFMNGIDYATMQPRQTGKAQPLDSLILTPRGWVTMEVLSVGDIVITPDGSTTPIVGVYPQGTRRVYELRLKGNRKTQSCGEHLWKVRTESWNEYRILQLEDILNISETLFIPVYDEASQTTYDVEVEAISCVGMKVTQCIEVDHPDHLYITDDYIVTHNTVSAFSLIGWIIYCAGYEFQIGAMAKDNSLREDNVKRIKSIGENLPSWWVAEDKFKDKKNTTEIFYNALRTHLVSYVANADPRKADLQARGASPPVFWWDEFEFQVNIDVSYPTIIASTGTARENAKKNGKPYSNLITTTAGDPKKPECRAAAKLLDGAMPFSEFLYDLESNEKLHEVVEAASPQKMILGIFSHLQLGFDNKWLRNKIQRGQLTRDQVMRDYLNRRVSISEDPIIPKETLATITSSEQEPKYMQILNGKYVIYWYIDKATVESAQFKERPIVVGCDSSEMIGRDATTLVGVDPRDLSVVFTFRCSEGNINTMGVIISQLLLMFPKMVWVPENKSSGTSLIDVVSLILRKEGHNPFYRMFNWIVNNRSEQEFAKYNIRDTNLLDTSAKRFFGIKTDKGKREELYGTTLLSAANKSASRVRDKTLINELSSLTVRNGRVDHEVGGHDDTVVAWLMAMWFIMNAKHLDIYGIRPGVALSHINPASSDKTRLSMERQEKVRAKLEELEANLKYQRDPSLRRLIEADISLMKEMIDSGPIPTPATADELNRDPRRYTDPITAEQSRTPVKIDDVEKSLRMILGVS